VPGGVGKHALAEAFLLGNSTIGASASVCLGRGYDAFVGAEDLVILQGSFGQGTGGTPTIPEPGSAMLLVFGAAALLRRRASIGRTGQ
jgi:hypothetical protein